MNFKNPDQNEVFIRRIRYIYHIKLSKWQLLRQIGQQVTPLYVSFNLTYLLPDCLHSRVSQSSIPNMTKATNKR